MECDVINHIIEIIQEKRKEYIKQNGVMPNMIVMDSANQVLLNMHFINKIGTDMNTIYGMKILIDNSIYNAHDIKVYYWSELERQDTQDENFTYNKVRDVWYEFSKRIDELFEEIMKGK